MSLYIGQTVWTPATTWEFAGPWMPAKLVHLTNNALCPGYYVLTPLHWESGHIWAVSRKEIRSAKEHAGYCLTI